MPPLEPVDPAEGDIAPDPMDVLTLGGNRWLGPNGRVLPKPIGIPVDLQPNTLKFWEEAARRGGYVLSELLAE